MSMRTSADMEVPEETQRVAQAAFPHGNGYLTVRDELGTIYRDEQFAGLFSGRGRPAESPWRLALVTVLQFGENLSDPQAAECVRSRIDWKYLLGLRLDDAGFDFSVLSEFRDRLITGSMEMQLLDSLLALFAARGLLKGRRKQRTDSTHVLAAIRSLSRLECVQETMRKALNTLARVAPDWLQARAPMEWYTRYDARLTQYRRSASKAAYQALVETIGADGYQLLDWAYAADAPETVRQQGVVEIVRRIWVQNFYREAGQVRWREAGNLPPGELLIQSPHDLEVRYSQKREMDWEGYKVHLTETCEAEEPHLITHVATTPATLPDGEMTAPIQTALMDKGLPPSQHLLDSGYVDAEHLVTSQETHGIEILGPVAADTTWQARSGQGFDLAHFVIDWRRQQVTCPMGHPSQIWSESHDSYANPVVHVRFAAADCQACAVRARCTTAKKNPRSLKLRSQKQHEALQRARERQAGLDFWQQYRLRSGIEGTLSQGVRSTGLRRSRYIGQAKTHLQMILSAIAINLARFVAWINEIPLAATRVGAFAALAPT